MKRDAPASLDNRTVPQCEGVPENTKFYLFSRASFCQQKPPAFVQSCI